METLSKKILTLSNHAGEQQRLSRDAREAAQLDARRALDAAIAQRALRIEQNWQVVRSAVRTLRPWRAITSLRGWLRLLLIVMPKPPAMASPSDQEAIWASGQLGEQRVRERLRQLLGDD